MDFRKTKRLFWGLMAGVFVMAGTAAYAFPAYAETDMSGGPGAPNGPGAPTENTEIMAGTNAEPVNDVSEMKAMYRVYKNGSGWSGYTKDNTYVSSPGGTYVTALQATLENQPAGMSGTIAYQVNLSGFGWQEWKENFVEAGDSAGSMPLEAVKMKLTGQLAEQYDLYYSVYQNGSWTEQVMNGETAGVEAQGLRVEGLRVAVVKKGAPAPEASAMTSFGSAVDPSRPMVALTFDDGPSGVTPRILDSLESHGARATFYMVGNRMNSYPDTVRRMVALGCEVGNHSWNHTYLTSLSADGIHGNLNQMDATLQEIAGVRCPTMRPPGGYINAASQQALASYGVPAIMWSIDTLDWKTRNAQATINSVLSRVRDGDIILMHDLYSATGDAAVALIPELINRGYQLVTVSELAAHRGGMQPGQVYHAFR